MDESNKSVDKLHFDFSDKNDPSRKKIVVASAALIVAIIISSLMNVFLLSDLFVDLLASFYGIILFAATGVIIYAIGYYLLNRFVSRVDENVMESMHESRSRSLFSILFRMIKILFFVYLGLAAIYTIEMLASTHYLVGPFVGSFMSVQVVLAIIFVFLSIKFVSWYRYRRNSSILLYCLSFMTIAMGIALGFFNNSSALKDNILRSEVPLPSNTQYEAGENEKNQNSRASFLISLIPARIAFILYWAATTILLKSYSFHIGKGKFWIYASLPLISMLAGTVMIFELGNESELLRAIITGASFDAGGVLFALVFLTVAKYARESNHRTISHHLTVCAVGTVFYLVSLGSPSHVNDWIHIPYPPFFIFSFYFLSIAGYLYAVSFYFAAVSIARDLGVRKSIRSFAIKEASLFDDVGTAEMQGQLQKKVSTIIEQQQHVLQEQTGVEEHEIPEQELMSYLKQAITEVKRKKSD